MWQIPDIFDLTNTTNNTVKQFREITFYSLYLFILFDDVISTAIFNCFKSPLRETRIIQVFLPFHGAFYPFVDFIHHFWLSSIKYFVIANGRLSHSRIVKKRRCWVDLHSHNSHCGKPYLNCNWLVVIATAT